MANYNTIGEFATALNNAYKGLNDQMEGIIRGQVPELTESVKKRVSGAGVDRDGKAFSTPYSRSQKSKRQKNGNGSLGKQIKHKGFYFQGTMWDSFGMIGSKKTGNLITATLGFKGQNAYVSNERLNEIHSDREEIAIAAANKDEATELTRKIGFQIGEYLKNSL